MLEEGSFRGRTADFTMMFLFGGATMIVCQYASQAGDFYVGFSVPWDFCESSVFGTGVYDYVGLCVGEEKSFDNNELFWRCQFSSKFYYEIYALLMFIPGAVSSLGSVGIFRTPGQCRMGRCDWHCCRSHVLLHGRRLSQQTRRLPTNTHATVPVCFMFKKKPWVIFFKQESVAGRSANGSRLHATA